MKKLFRSLSILLFFAAFFYVCNVSNLMNEGYNYESAKLITLVDYKIIPVNADYIALMED